MDDIANYIASSFKSDNNFKIIKFSRGSYKLPLLYNKKKCNIFIYELK